MRARGESGKVGAEGSPFPSPQGKVPDRHFSYGDRLLLFYLLWFAWPNYPFVFLQAEEKILFIRSLPYICHLPLRLVPFCSGCARRWLSTQFVTCDNCCPKDSQRAFWIYQLANDVGGSSLSILPPQTSLLRRLAPVLPTSGLLPHQPRSVWIYTCGCDPRPGRRLATSRSGNEFTAGSISQCTCSYTGFDPPKDLISCRHSICNSPDSGPILDW